MVHVRACCMCVRAGRRLEALGVQRREVRRPRLQRGGGRHQRAHGDERRLDGDRGRRELVAHLRRQAGAVEGGRRGAAVMVSTLGRQRRGMRARGRTPAGIRRRGGVGKGRSIRVIGATGVPVSVAALPSFVPPRRLPCTALTRLPVHPGLTGLEALYLAHNRITLMPPQSVHMTALATLDLTGNPVEAMPSRMRRLDNMNALLHSKQKRQALISRANNVRLSVKAAIMRDVMNPQQADR